MNALPFFLLETTSQEFYSKTLTRLQIAKHQATVLWKNAKDLRFWDGRVPGFITDPIKEVVGVTLMTLK